LPFISEKVVADLGHHLGFYFNPNTTVASESVTTDSETNIDFLKRDPQGAEHSLFCCAIPAVVDKIVPTTK